MPISVPTLRTERRLVLRSLTEADTDAVAAVFADPARSALLGANLADPVQVRRMIDTRLSYAGPPELGHWVFERDGTVIGLGHLRPTQELPEGLIEIGWFIGPEHGGTGLATEAAGALLDYGLTTLRLPAVWALIHEDNAASTKLAARLGFRDVGGGRHYGGPHRVHVALPNTP